MFLNYLTHLKFRLRRRDINLDDLIDEYENDSKHSWMDKCMMICDLRSTETPEIKTTEVKTTEFIPGNIFLDIKELVRKNGYLFKGLENCLYFQFLAAELLGAKVEYRYSVEKGIYANSHFIGMTFKILNNIRPINNDNDMDVRGYQVTYSKDPLVQKAFAGVTLKQNELISPNIFGTNFRLENLGLITLCTLNLVSVSLDEDDIKDSDIKYKIGDWISVKNSIILLLSLYLSPLIIILNSEANKFTTGVFTGLFPILGTISFETELIYTVCSLALFYGYSYMIYLWILTRFDKKLTLHDTTITLETYYILKIHPLYFMTKALIKLYELIKSRQRLGCKKCYEITS